MDGHLRGGVLSDQNHKEECADECGRDRPHKSGSLVDPSNLLRGYRLVRGTRWGIKLGGLVVQT